MTIGWPSGWAGTWAQATAAAISISAWMRKTALVTSVPLRLALRLMLGAHHYDIALGRGLTGCIPLAFWRVPLFLGLEVRKKGECWNLELGWILDDGVNLALQPLDRIESRPGMIG